MSSLENDGPFGLVTLSSFDCGDVLRGNQAVSISQARIFSDSSTRPRYKTQPVSMGNWPLSVVLDALFLLFVGQKR